MLALVSYDTNPGWLIGIDRHASHWSDLSGGTWMREDTEEESDSRLSGLGAEKHIHTWDTEVLRVLTDTIQKGKVT